MRKTISLALVPALKASLLLALCHPALGAEPLDAAALLRAADHFRTGQDNLRVETVVTTLNRDGGVDKERLYTVYVQADHKSLVLMKSPAEAGQKVLMLGDDFWLLMPGSQRPLRIAPTQKLLGDASTGDIATMSWSEDYSGAWVADESCAPDPDAGRDTAQPCQHLSLTASRKGVTYQRIELWLGQVRHEPLKADLYVQSDKLAKQARFIFDKPAAPTLVTEMRLQDQLSNHKQTRVRYAGRAPRQVPEAWLNPMFLARNPALE